MAERSDHKALPNLKKDKGEKRKRKDGVVLLEDLAPRKEVKGGTGKIVFGQGGDPFSTPKGEKKNEKK